MQTGFFGNPKITGNLLHAQQSEGWDFDPQRGYTHQLSFKGAMPLELQQLQQTYVRQGIACKLVYHQGGTATLEVDDSTMQFTLDTWQILGNDESRDALTHPIILNKLTDDEVTKLRQAINNETLPADLFGDKGDMADYSGTDIERIYGMILRGATEFKRPQYVIRHTTNAPSFWSANISDYGVGCIYTPAQLLSEVANGALWTKPMPGRLQYKIANIPAPTHVDNYSWGWLKGPSTETTAANNRVEITTEYVLEQWSTDYYDEL